MRTSVGLSMDIQGPTRQLTGIFWTTQALSRASRKPFMEQGGSELVS
jgi:hypothetical protein